jgi:hypothetical protein
MYTVFRSSLLAVALLIHLAINGARAQVAPVDTYPISGNAAEEPASTAAPATNDAPPEQTDESQTSGPSTEATAPQPVTSATAAPVAVQAQAPQIPEDVFWVSRRVSVPIEGGLLGLEAGDEVRVLKQEGTKWTATNEKGLFQIDSYLLIKDPVVAGQLRAAAAQNNAAAQAAAAAAARAAEALEMQRRLEFERSRKDQVLPGSSLTGETRLKEPPKR